jgi:tRNA threonylcarbamoyladenosine modification (KEOPS) complex Cgi121 subunit
MNARIRMNDGIARSKSMQIEMLLLICGSMKIDKALKLCGAKDPKNFLIFASDEKSLSAFVRKNKIKVTEALKMELDPRIAGNVAMTELLSE